MKNLSSPQNYEPIPFLVAVPPVSPKSGLNDHSHSPSVFLSTFCQTEKAFGRRPFHAVRASPPQGLFEHASLKSWEDLPSTLFFLMSPLNCHCGSRSVTTTAAPRIDGCGGRLSTVDSIKAPLGSDSSFMARYIILLEASIRRWS